MLGAQGSLEEVKALAVIRRRVGSGESYLGTVDSCMPGTSQNLDSVGAKKLGSRAQGPHLPFWLRDV